MKVRLTITYVGGGYSFVVSTLENDLITALPKQNVEVLFRVEGQDWDHCFSGASDENGNLTLDFMNQMYLQAETTYFFKAVANGVSSETYGLVSGEAAQLVSGAEDAPDLAESNGEIMVILGLMVAVVLGLFWWSKS